MSRGATYARSEFSSKSSASAPGAAQFVSNLSPEQLHHLQFSVPRKDVPERFSQFLENPRSTPVPKRFTFNLLELAARGAAVQEESDKKAGKDGAKHKRMGSGKSEISIPSTIDFLKEVEKIAAVDWRFYATGICIAMLNLVVAWDATMVPMALPSIASALKGASLETLWLGIAFFVAATCFLPLFATFSDIFGRKAMLVAALTFYTAGSFIAAVTGNFTGLHFGRSVQGVGAGGVYALSVLIVSDLSSIVDRRIWKAIMGATWALGAITGPLIAGALVDRGQWRWIFWLHLPFCGLAFIILPFFAQLKPASPDAILPRLRNVDWLGYVLFTGSLVSILVGLTWGGTVNPWSDFRTSLPISFGAIGLVIFSLWSWFSPFPSIVSLESFLDPTSLVTYAGAAIQGLVVFALLYFLPVYFSVVKSDHNLAQIAVCLLAWSIPIAAFAFVAFFVILNIGLHRPLIWCAWCLTVLGVALTALFTPNIATVAWVAIAIVSGSAIGLLYASILLTSTQSIREDKDDGQLQQAMTNLAFFQTLGQTAGVALGGAVLQNELLRNYLKLQFSRTSALSSASNAMALVNTVKNLDEGLLKVQTTDAYVDALTLIWIILAAFAGAALVMSLFMKNVVPKGDPGVELKRIDDGYVV